MINEKEVFIRLSFFFIDFANIKFLSQRFLRNLEASQVKMDKIRKNERRE